MCIRDSHRIVQHVFLTFPQEDYDLLRVIDTELEIASSAKRSHSHPPVVVKGLHEIAFGTPSHLRASRTRAMNADSA